MIYTQMSIMIMTMSLAFPLVGAPNVGGFHCRCDPPYANFVCVDVNPDINS